MTKHIDLGHPVYVSGLRKLGLYPEDLTTAFEVLFNKDDLCIYYPTSFDESPDISFYFFSLRDNDFYKYTISADDWLFRDDYDGVDTVVDNLITVEEVYTRSEFRDLLHFMRYRLIGVPELEVLEKFNGFLDGVASYVQKERLDEKTPRTLPGAGQREASKES